MSKIKRVSFMIILAASTLGLSDCRKDYGITPREFDLCQLMAEGVSHDFSYYLDCFPKNSDRAEYSVPLEVKFNEGLTCIANDHLSNLDKMYKEALYKLDQCSQGK